MAEEQNDRELAKFLRESTEKLERVLERIHLVDKNGDGGEESEDED